jgi:hypothetical protein
MVGFRREANRAGRAKVAFPPLLPISRVTAVDPFRTFDWR